MRYCTYILISEKNGRRYFGSCEDLQKRLRLHNAGRVKSTKPYLPYRILHVEYFETRPEAYRREMFYKSPEGYRYLKDNDIL